MIFLYFYLAMIIISFIWMMFFMEDDSVGWKGTIVLSVIWPISLMILILAGGHIK